jgi:CRP-like cAMP-binding protein
MLLDRRGGAGWKGVTRGRTPQPVRRRTEDRLQPMERVLLLQASPLMAGATSAQLLRLAAIARQVPLLPGTSLVREGDEAAIHIVIGGALSVEARGLPPLVAQPGDAVGLYETLADAHAEATVSVAEAGSALRIGGRDLFDLLADHVDLLQGLFSAILRSEPAAPAVESARSLDGSSWSDPQEHR